MIEENVKRSVENVCNSPVSLLGVGYAWRCNMSGAVEETKIAGTGKGKVAGSRRMSKQYGPADWLEQLRYGVRTGRRSKHGREGPFTL